MPSRTLSIVDQLKGQVMRVPNLDPVFARWNSAVNPHLWELEELVNDRIEKWIPDEKLRLKVKKIDVPLITAT